MAEAEEELNLYGACVMCRHMKATQLEDILQALQEPRDDQVIEIDSEIIARAQHNLDEMFRLAEWLLLFIENWAFQNSPLIFF